MHQDALGAAHAEVLAAQSFLARLADTTREDLQPVEPLAHCVVPAAALAMSGERSS